MSAARGRTEGNPRADELLKRLRQATVSADGAPDPALGGSRRGRLHPHLSVRLRVAVALTFAVVAASVAALAASTTTDVAVRWLQLVATLVVATWCIQPLLGPAWTAVRRLRPTPDVAVLLGAAMALTSSVVQLVRGDPDTWFGAPAVALTGWLLARHLEERTLESAGSDSPEPGPVRWLRTWFTPVVVGVAAVGLVIQLIAGGSGSRALGVAVAVLLIGSFPAAALTAPAALAAARRRAAQQDAAPPDLSAIPAAGLIDTVVINRTGVLTTGELALQKIAVTGRLSKKAALTAAAAVEQGSEHPIARAVVAGARVARIELPRVRDFEDNPGEGASARIKDTEVTVGKAALFEHVDAGLIAHADRTPGQTVFVGWDGRARAALTVDDRVRDRSRPAVARLKGLGLTPYLLTDGGDAHARDVAESVGIDPGKVRSGDQARGSDLVAELQRQGRHVAVIGRPRTGLLFDDDDLDVAADTVELAQRTQRITRQNLGLAAGYHAIALPLAAAGVVHPALAALLGAAAAAVPLANARRLTR